MSKELKKTKRPNPEEGSQRVDQRWGAGHPLPPNADWDVITLQADLDLPDDGIYDALSIVAAASLANPFVVSFVWLESGIPGSQPFVIYEPGFSTIETGDTVPEPTTALLVVGGLVLLGTCSPVEKKCFSRNTV